MFRFNILKLSSTLLILRRPIIIRRELTNTYILYKENERNERKEQDKKIEIKVDKKENYKNKNKQKEYHDFLCKCGSGFYKFSEFLDHIKTFHKIENVDFPEMLKKKNGSEWGIKFYWKLSCQCGNKFSSSLCNADLRIEKNQINLIKKYRLQCLKCNKYAKFINEEYLNQFLKERVKQKLIYSFYKEEFSKFLVEKDSEKELDGHKQNLCEKCKLSLTGYCGDR